MDPDDRAAQGLAHLQSAAKEAIAAARAFLDVAEDLVGDPDAVAAVADALGSVVRVAAQRGRAAAGMAGDDGGEDDGDTARVEHIRIT